MYMPVVASCNQLNHIHLFTVSERVMCALRSLFFTCHDAEDHHHLIHDASACAIVHHAYKMQTSTQDHQLSSPELSLLVDGQPRSQLHIRFELLR